MDATCLLTQPLSPENGNTDFSNRQLHSFVMNDSAITSPVSYGTVPQQSDTRSNSILTHGLETSRGSFSSGTSDFPLQSKTCTCSARAFEVLRTLHERSENLQLPFDTVLAVNKNITRQISDILDCRCTQDTPSIMTLATAVAKLISWYKSIFCNLPSSTGPTAPITLGAFRLDDADEKCVKIQVALNELKKVDALLARICQTSYSSHAQQEARLYGDLMTFLRRKIRDIVDELQRDLRMDFINGI